MMKKYVQNILFILLGVCLAAFLPACGGGEEESTQEETEESTEEVTENSTEETMEEEETKEVNEEEVPTEEPEEGTEIAEGTFAGIEQGDYAYFLIKTKEGEEKSFMVLQTDAVFEQIMEEPKLYIGKPVKVYWEKTVENLDAAGGKVEIEKYLKSEVFNPVEE